MFCCWLAIYHRLVLTMFAAFARPSNETSCMTHRSPRQRRASLLMFLLVGLICLGETIMIMLIVQLHNTRSMPHRLPPTTIPRHYKDPATLISQPSEMCSIRSQISQGSPYHCRAVSCTSTVCGRYLHISPTADNITGAFRRSKGRPS